MSLGMLSKVLFATATTPSEFILDAARRTAEETLLDQVLLRVDPDAYGAFLERLDAPAKPNDRLRKTMGIRSSLLRRRKMRRRRR